MKRVIFLFALLGFCAAAGAQLFKKTEELLEPQKAFRFSARAVDGGVEVNFAIADGYYLYRERFRFVAEGARLGAPELPPGIAHKDEFFGEMQIYRRAASIRIPVQSEGRLDLTVTSQGCADVGVCYVPMESKATLQLAAADAPARFSIFASDMEIARLFEGNTALVLAGFFVFGLLLTFTPCVLPMIPILSAIIAGEGKGLTKQRGLALSSSYVLGMALAYAGAGVAAAYSGTLIAAALQNAWVLGAFALIFVALALSMFGFYDLRLPGFLHDRLQVAHQRLRGGQVASVAAMGVLSAVIVSPCVAAPLAGALLYISQTRDVLLGGAALFVMALGMGVPLVAVGVSEGALLPKAGAWMAGVRKFFGVLLLAVAIWIVSPVTPPMAQLLVWGALLIGAGVFLRAVDPLPAGASGWARLWKAAGIVALVAGVSVLVSAFSPKPDGARPAAAALPWTRVASLQELETKLKTPGRPAMLDFYADWCVSCKEMERFTFSDPKVRAELDQMLLLQVDVTAHNDDDKALLKRFSLFGPPGIIFFDADGREIKGLRVIGYQNAARFLKTLSLARAP